MNEFGNFLYSLRKGKGMTQQELADMLNVTNKAISKWETGEAFPETAQLVPLATIFGVTVDELLRGRRETETDAPMSESGANPSPVSAETHAAAENPPPMSVAAGDIPDMVQWRRTRAVLSVLAACLVLFALAYLITACLTEGLSRREVIVRGSVCLLLMALAVAGSCAAGIFITQKLYGTANESGKNALRRLRFTSVLGLPALMLGVCCFVFFQLYATPAYYHDSALIAGMIAGCVFVVAAGFLFAVGLVGWVSYARRAEKKR